MSREIPEVVRAAAGLAATVLDEARRLPEALPGLPVRAIGRAMQHAMKVQQTYAGLVARGDELFTGLRGDGEPGLARFDDEEDDDAGPGFRGSAFDRVSDDTLAPVLPLAEQSGTAVDEAADDAVNEAVDEAADEAVPEVPGTEGLLPGDSGEDAAVTEDADALQTALLESDSAGTAAVGTSADGTGADATQADGTQADAVQVDVIQAVDESGSPVAAATGGRTDVGGTGAGTAAGTTGARAPRRSPVAGYDSFSIAQLRGRLRGYALSTVTDLLAYEEATRARAPYLRMLRNRLEKLEEQAVEASPLTPRGH